MTFDIGLHEACVRVGGRAGVRYVITKFSQMDSLPNFLTRGAPQARFARGAPLKILFLKALKFPVYTVVKFCPTVAESLLASGQPIPN